MLIRTEHLAQPSSLSILNKYCEKDDSEAGTSKEEEWGRR